MDQDLSKKRERGKYIHGSTQNSAFLGPMRSDVTFERRACDGALTSAFFGGSLEHPYPTFPGISASPEYLPAVQKLTGGVIALLASCCLRPNSPFMKDGFSANPRCDGHMRQHHLQRIDLQSHNPASKGQQPT